MVENGDAFGMQAFLQIGPASLLSLNEATRDFRDRGQLLPGGQSVFALHGTRPAASSLRAATRTM